MNLKESGQPGGMPVYYKVIDPSYTSGSWQCRSDRKSVIDPIYSFNLNVYTITILIALEYDIPY